MVDAAGLAIAIGVFFGVAFFVEAAFFGAVAFLAAVEGLAAACFTEVYGRLAARAATADSIFDSYPPDRPTENVVLFGPLSRLGSPA